jgi:hypothetical protein
MKFNLKSFLLALASIGPSLISGIMSLVHEVPNTSKLQLATDSLHLATGVTNALASGDPEIQQDAQVASAIIGATMDSVAAVSAPPVVVTQ